MKTVRRPPYPKWNPGYFPCSSLTPLPLSSRRPSVSFGGFGLRLELEVGTFDTDEAIEMQTSTGDVASYVRWGKVAFQVDGEPAELTVFKDTSGGEFFLPFADATSGDETYPSGRYLEIHELHGGIR